MIIVSGYRTMLSWFSMLGIFG